MMTEHANPVLTQRRADQVVQHRLARHAGRAERAQIS